MINVLAGGSANTGRHEKAGVQVWATRTADLWIREQLYG
jgi:hypothetical protein